MIIVKKLSSGKDGKHSWKDGDLPEVCKNIKNIQMEVREVKNATWEISNLFDVRETGHSRRKNQWSWRQNDRN